MSIFPKHFLQESTEGAAGGTGKEKEAPDVAKVVADSMKGLGDEIKKLSQRMDKLATPAAPAPKKKADDEEEDDEVDLLLNPKKAVEKITSRVREAITKEVTADATAKDQFNSKFTELASEFPEINDTKSDLHIRAKEILEASGSKGWDSRALEAAVLRAASEKGMVAVKHRKQTTNDDDNDDYLGGGSGGSSGGDNRRRNRSDKLPAATLAFAEAVGMNTKDPKVLERLTKTHNDRKGNWNKYK
jgi:hypothetical protein